MHCCQHNLIVVVQLYKLLYTLVLYDLEQQQSATIKLNAEHFITLT